MALTEYFSKYADLAGKDTLSILIEYLNQEPKEEGYNFKFQCPYCMDTGEDNLIYNSQKDILTCFANENHAKDVIKKIIKEHKESFIKEGNNQMNYKNYKYNYNKLNTEPIEDYVFVGEDIKLNLHEEFLKQMKKTAQEYINYLWGNEILLNNLKIKRGFTADTIKYSYIGYDKDRRAYAIPKIAYSTEGKLDIFNFEFRQDNLSSKGMSVLPDLPTCLCQINKYNEGITDTLLVCEGFMDGIAYRQHLKQKGILKKYHIVTPSNGVKVLYDQLKYIKWSKYKHFLLCIDNDFAGDQAFAKIQDKFKVDDKTVFQDGRINCYKCTHKCDLFTEEKQVMIEAMTCAENCKPLWHYEEKIKNKNPDKYITSEKEAVSKGHPCKTCDIQCDYKTWYNSRCKDMNDYIRKGNK